MNEGTGRVAPASGDWHARTEASFARQDFMQTIGARIVARAPGRCVLELDVRDGLRQQHGFVHAGVTTTLADSAGG